MHGLINSAIQSYVVETHGLNTWDHLKLAADCNVDFLLAWIAMMII